MNLKYRYVKNSLHNVSGWAWLAIVNIVTTPYIFHKLGYEQYGILSLVLMVLGYFAFLDFGLGDAVIKYVAHYYALKDYDKINKIVSSIFLLFMAVGILGGLLIYLFTRYFVIDLFKIPLEYRSNALYCFYIAAFGFFLNLVFAVISKMPEAIQRFDISNIINILIGTFVNIANVAVLYLGYGLREMIIVNLIAAIFGIAIFYISVKKIIPEFRILFHFSIQDMKEVFNFGLYTVFTKFSSIISQSINQIIVGVILGPSGVSILNIPSKLISRFQSFIYKISYAIFPMTSELSALNDVARIEKICIRLSKYIYMISSIFFIVLIAYSKSILNYWMGNDFSQKAYLPTIIISVALYIVSITMVPSLIAIGMGKPRYNAIFSFGGTMVNILLVYPLTKTYGITGSAISFLIGSLNSLYFIIIINKRVLNISNSRYILNVFGRITLMNICFLGLFILLQRYSVHNILSFIIVLILSGIAMMITLYRFGLLQEDRDMIRGVVFK